MTSLALPFRLATLLLIGAAPALAQDAHTLLPDDSRIPLHTMPDDPIGGGYGLWAAGSNYKASFHNGFCFYPYRGVEGSSVRVQWRTESIARGGTELLEARPTVHTSDWRHELRHHHVSEIYDVRNEGVEQSFVLHQRPSGNGDVLVVGRVASELQVPVVPNGVQELNFNEDGEAIVRYGRALAFDATGREAPVTTACDGERITLRLSGTFVDTAEYPLTIDPLTSAVSLGFSLAGAPIVTTAMAADNEQLSGKVMIVFSRQVSATDTDAWGYLYDKNMATVGNTLAFHDITSSWDTTELDTCFVEGADRYVVAFQRQFSSTLSAVRIYLHDETSTTSNSGPILIVVPSWNTRAQNPQLGGMTGPGNKALLVVEEDPIGPANVPGTDVMVAVIDAAVNTVTGTWTVDQVPSSSDVERPTVTPIAYSEYANSTPDWYVVYPRRDGATTYRILYARVDPFNLHNMGTAYEMYAGSDPIDSVVAAGTYASAIYHRLRVAWIRRTTGFATGRVETLRLYPNQSQPDPVRTLVTSSPLLGDLDLAFDWTTKSHWALTYSQQTSLQSGSLTAIRLGISGAIVESQVMATSYHPGEASIAYSDQVGGQRFLTCYGLEDSYHTLKGRQFIYDPTAGTTIYGTGCNGATIHANGQPYAGNENFSVEIGPLTTSSNLAIVAIGFQSATLPTPWPGCQLLVNPIVAVFLVGSGSTNTATFAQPLSDAPLFTGNLYFQGGILGTLAVTPGLEVRVR